MKKKLHRNHIVGNSVDKFLTGVIEGHQTEKMRYSHDAVSQLMIKESHIKISLWFIQKFKSTKSMIGSLIESNFCLTTLPKHVWLLKAYECVKKAH